MEGFSYMGSNALRQNYYRLDYLKLFCAFVVIAIHTSPLLALSEFADHIFDDCFTVYAVPIFYACTGFLLIVNGNEENSISLRHHIRKTIKKVVRLYLIWTAVYMPLTIYGWTVNKNLYGDSIAISAVKFIRSFLFVGENYYSWTLWYLNGLIVLPLCVGLFLVANHAVIFLYGAEFQPTALTIRLLCPLILIKGFGDLYCYQMAYASKNEKIIVPASATASAINVATNAVLIPSLMQNGAVIASVASELITNMVQFVYMKKKVKFKLNMKPLVQSIITVAAMAVCVWKVGTLNFSNTVLLALEVIVGSVVYVVLNILMKNQLMLEVINMTKQRIHNATKKRI